MGNIKIHEDENTNVESFTAYCCGLKEENEKYRWGRQEFVGSNMLWKLIFFANAWA